MNRGKLIAVTLTVLAIFILVNLGLWQLERADEKQALFDDFALNQTQSVDLALQPDPLPARYQSVEVTGTFTDNRYFLLDNQIWQGQVGYQVIGLLAVEELPFLVPINMGWVTAGIDRNYLPELTLPTGEVHIEGLFYVPAEDAFMLGDQVIEAGSWPQRIQQLKLDALSDATQLPLAPYVVLLSAGYQTASANSSPSEFGWPRQWQPQVMTPQKHRAYAWQWFSLAIACCLVFWFASRSKKTKTEDRK
ncbi:MAG TPA: SURF1 family protein [Pseudidiomarina sp.]|nr:SURF1 family protein [Pseudidiomarina sp.]